MAAGRNRGYRGTQSVDRESSYTSSRRDAGYPKDEYEQPRNVGKIRERDVRDWDSSRVRLQDIKGREAVNGGYSFSSSRSDSGGVAGDSGGPKRCGNSVKLVDREPGELSSDGSDDGIKSKSKGKDKEVSEVDNGVEHTQVTRKRKFSPVVWDRDDEEVKGLSRIRVVSTTRSHCPAPQASKSDRPSSVSVPVIDMEESRARSNEPIDLQDSLVDALEENDVQSVMSGSPDKLHDNSFQENQLGNSEGGVHLEDEDYVSTRHISSSRWADDASSPVDEGQIGYDSYDKDKPKSRRSSPAFIETRGNKRSSSPEAREVKIEGPDGPKSRSPDSDAGIHSRPSSVKRVTENDVDRKDYMEVDSEQNNDDTSLSMSETDSENRDDSHYTPEPPAPPQRTVNMLQGCRSVDEFERLNKIDEGTYGVVYRARDRKTGEVVALKKVKMEKEREGFPLTSLREINVLLSFHHPSIVDVKEVVVGRSLDSIFMVMEYMEHDLKALMETMKQPFSQSEVKCLMLQLLDGVKYLHDNWVLHRDLKTSNLLLNNRGELKICDFGLARQYGSPLKPYTHLVVTLWYRAPELLLGEKQYSTAIDMWSLGCIMAELLSKEPLFKGKSEFDQLDKIFRILGTPNESIWPEFTKLPGVKVNYVKHQYNQLRKKFPATSFTGSPVLSDAGFDLLNRLLTYDPEKRITVDAALNHEWFREVPLPKSKEFMPTFPAHHAQDRRVRRVLKSPDPLGEQRRKELQQAELGTGGLFG